MLLHTSEVQSEVDVEEPWLRGSLLFPYLKGKRTRCYNIRRSTTRKQQKPRTTTDAYLFLFGLPVRCLLRTHLSREYICKINMGTFGRLPCSAQLKFQLGSACSISNCLSDIRPDMHFLARVNSRFWLETVSILVGGDGKPSSRIQLALLKTSQYGRL